MFKPVKQRSLRYKIWSGFVLFNLVLLGTILVTVWQLETVEDTTLSLINHDSPIARASSSMLTALLDSSSVAKDWGITGDKKHYDTLKNIWQTRIFPANTRLKNIAAARKDQDITTQLQKIEFQLYRIESAQLALGDLINKKNDTQVKDALTRDINPLVDAAVSDIKILTDAQQRFVANKLRNINLTIDNILIIDLMMLLLGIALSIIYGVIITQSVTRPIQHLVNIAKTLANGKLEKSTIVQETTEFEDLNRAINNVIDTLDKIASVTENIAVGDYSDRVEVKSHDDRLAITINQMLDNFTNIVTQANSIAKGNYSSDVKPRSQEDKLGQALQNMTRILRLNKKTNEDHSWLQDGLAQLASQLSETNEIKDLCNNAISTICRYVSALKGMIYLYDEKTEQLYTIGTFASTDDEIENKRFKLKQGIIGQVAYERKPILLNKIDDDKNLVETGTLAKNPTNLYIYPLLYEGDLIGVIEIASLNKLSELNINYMLTLAPLVAGHMRTAQQQLLSEKLLSQLEEKAQEIEKASEYKSEFLANMSHELRTPLNSLLVLGKLLEENKDSNLTREQIESLQIIIKNGNDLLTLINDILDLSKVEAGKIEITPGEVYINNIIKTVDSQFSHLAAEKGIELILKVNDHDLPETIFTDDLRLDQIIRNLLSNAIKFTETGHVSLEIFRPSYTPNFAIHNLIAEKTIALSVTDTGVGINKEKLQMIFDPFQQADGTTTRKYGGTGLGLSICTKLSELLGGYIDVKSNEGQGSTFTIYIPENINMNNPEERNIVTEKPSTTTIKQGSETSTQDEKISQPATAITVVKKSSATKILANQQKTPEQETEQLSKHLTGKNIAIIDDDMRSLLLIAKKLTENDIHVIKASQLADFTKNVTNYPDVDVIFLKISDEITKIEEILNTLRLHKKLQKTAYIALLSQDLEKHQHEYINMGFKACLSKPLDINLLVRCLNKIFR